MNGEAFKIFYCSNIPSILAHAADAWFSLLAEGDETRLKRQKGCNDFSADLEYLSRLLVLVLPT